MLSITQLRKEVNNSNIYNIAVSLVISLVLSILAAAPAHAATYNEGAYGAGTYQSQSTTNNTSDSPLLGIIPSTGEGVLLATSIIAVCAGVSGTIISHRRRAKRNKALASEQ